MDTSTILTSGPPAERAEAIRRSVSCFIHGVLGLLIPVLGLVPAVSALVSWRIVARRFRGQWNPAHHYLKAGGIFGILGILSNTLLIVSIVMSIADGLLN
jgi:hypothetical protein